VTSFFFTGEAHLLDPIPNFESWFGFHKLLLVLDLFYAAIFGVAD